MRRRIRRGYVAIATMAAAISLLALSMAAPVVSTTVDFSIFNSSWNGTSDLAVMTYRSGKFAPTFEVKTTGTEIEVARLGFESLNMDPRSSALIVIGPSQSFSLTDGKLVGDFVRNGGILLLADDFGTGNSLLKGMNATSRFSNDLVMDLAYEKQPEFSVCFDLETDPLTTNVSTVLLNYPSSLVVNETTTQVIARSSVASWLDTDGDRQFEWGEPRGPFALMAKERLGEGAIVLISDPSVLINGMSRYLDNSIFSDNLIDYVSGDRESVYFDESHRDFFDPITAVLKLAGGFSMGAKVALAVLTFVLIMWIATDLVDRAISWAIKKAKFVLAAMVSLFEPLFRKKKVPEAGPPDKEGIMKEIAESHPDWSPGLVRYVLGERERHGGMFGRRRSGYDEPDSAQNHNDEEHKPTVDKEVHPLS